MGGLITAGSSYLLDQRRAQRERLREAEVRAIELRRAARLVQAELMAGIAAVRQTKDGGEYYRLSPDTLQINSWATEKAVLAPALTFPAWNKLVLAFHSLAFFKVERDKAIAGGIEECARDDTEHLEGVLADLKQGMDAITHLL